MESEKIKEALRILRQGRCIAKVSKAFHGNRSRHPLTLPFKSSKTSCSAATIHSSKSLPFSSWFTFDPLWSFVILCDREPHHLRQQLWCQHLGDRDSSDSCSLCKVCTSSFSGYKVSAGCVSAKPKTASARGYRKKGVEIRCWQGNVSHIDIMKQVCQECHVLIWLGG